MVSSPVRWLIAAPSAKLPSASTTLGISLVPEGRRLFQNLTVAENLQLAARKIAKKIAKNKRCYADTLRPRSIQRLRHPAHHVVLT